MEIEIRAEVNKKTLVERLNNLDGIIPKGQAERQVDTYIRHKYDTEPILIFRIRRKKGGALLSLKTKSIGAKDILWRDIDLPLHDPDKLEDILMNSGYVYHVLIDKVRDSFMYKNFEINIDQIRDLGMFIEIEFQADDVKLAENKLEEMRNMLRELGVNDDQIIEKGYVSLMLDKLSSRSADQ